jgi:phytoene synthase
MAIDEQATLIDQVEPDLLVASFFVPAVRRPDVLAIFGFEAELARVATQVAEPMVGQIRYAWWREQIGAIFEGRPVQAPVPRALELAVARHRLPRELLDRMIDGHTRDIDEVPFADIAQMEATMLETDACVMMLASRILGAGSDADGAAEHAGIAFGLSRQLTGFAHWASHRRLRVPADALARIGITQQDMFSGDTDPARFEPVFEPVKARIADRLRRLGASRWPRSALAALAPAAIARLCVSRTYNPLTSLPVSAWQRVLRISGANLIGRI